MTRVSRPLRHAVGTLLLLACGGDAPCIYYPCPLPEALTITVSSSTGAATIPGLALSGGNGAYGGPCTDRICHVPGGPGTYQVTISAPGYAPTSLTAQVTGESAGCNTCGHVDHQQLSVVLQAL